MQKSLFLFLALTLILGSCSKKSTVPTATTSSTATKAPALATAGDANKKVSDAKAIDVMKKYIAAIGGKEKLMGIKTMMTKMTGSTSMGEINITNYVKDGKSAMKTEMGGTTVMEQVFDGTAIQVSGMGGKQTITDAATIKAAKKQANLFEELDQLLSDKVVKKYMGMEDLNGKQVHKIMVIDEDKKESTQYFDVVTNLLSRTISPVDAMGSTSKQTMDFDDYKDVNGVMFPHMVKMSGGAIPFPLEMKITSMMMNSDLPDQLFKISNQIDDIKTPNLNFNSNESTTLGKSVIQLIRKDGVYILPDCKINGLLVKDFIFDSGASNVSISKTEASFMLKQGYITVDDFTGKENYEIANGEISEGLKINFREINISGIILKNVEGSVVLSNNAPLLLGMTALAKLGLKFNPTNGTLSK